MGNRQINDPLGEERNWARIKIIENFSLLKQRASHLIVAITAKQAFTLSQTLIKGLRNGEGPWPVLKGWLSHKIIKQTI